MSQLMQSGTETVRCLKCPLYSLHPLYTVFGMHDKSKFEVTCYALTPSDNSKWRKKIESEVEHFKDVSNLHFGDIAQLIFQVRFRERHPAK
jgi:hypothetical protein